jgi:hypothetical protein
VWFRYDIKSSYHTQKQESLCFTCLAQTLAFLSSSITQKKCEKTQTKRARMLFFVFIAIRLFFTLDLWTFAIVSCTSDCQ